MNSGLPALNMFINKNKSIAFWCTFDTKNNGELITLFENNIPLTPRPCRPQTGPMLAPWTLLSETFTHLWFWFCQPFLFVLFPVVSGGKPPSTPTRHHQPPTPPDQRSFQRVWRYVVNMASCQRKSGDIHLAVLVNKWINIWDYIHDWYRYHQCYPWNYHEISKSKTNSVVWS